MSERKVLVRGVSEDASEDDVSMIFESTRFCPDGGDVESCVRLDHTSDHIFVVTFMEQDVADRMISQRTVKIGNKTLKIECFSPPKKDVPFAAVKAESVLQQNQHASESVSQSSSVSFSDQEQEHVFNWYETEESKSDENVQLEHSVNPLENDSGISVAADSDDLEKSQTSSTVGNLSPILADDDSELPKESSQSTKEAPEDIHPPKPAALSDCSEMTSDRPTNAQSYEIDLSDFPQEKVKILHIMCRSGSSSILNRLSEYYLNFDVVNRKVTVVGESQSCSDVLLCLYEALNDTSNDLVFISNRAARLLQTKHGTAWLGDAFSQRKIFAVFYNADDNKRIIAQDSDAFEKASKALQELIISKCLPVDVAAKDFLSSDAFKKSISEYMASKVVVIDVESKDGIPWQVIVEGSANDVAGTADELEKLLKKNSIIKVCIPMKVGIARLLKTHHQEIIMQAIKTGSETPAKLLFNDSNLEITGPQADVEQAQRLVEEVYLLSVCYTKYEVNKPGQKLEDFQKSGSSGRNRIEELEDKYKCAIEVRALKVPARSPISNQITVDSADTLSVSSHDSDASAGYIPSFVSRGFGYVTGAAKSLLFGSTQSAPKATITIKQGSLAEFTESDVLVNLIAAKTEKLAKAGAVSSAFLKVGQDQLQQEFSKVGMPAKFGEDVSVTAATGNLKATKIFHAAIRKYESEKSVEKIYNLIMACLRLAISEKMSSIAFPTLGCGKLSYASDDIARCFLRAACDIDSKLEIFIVAYEQDLYDTFSDMFSNTGQVDATSDASAGTQLSSSSVNSAACAASPHQPTPPPRTRQAFVFHINSMDSDSLKTIIGKLADYFMKKTKTKTIPVENLPDMTTDYLGEIRGCESEDVEIAIDFTNNNIIVTGKSDPVRSARKKIFDILEKEKKSYSFERIKKNEGVKAYLSAMARSEDIQLPSYWNHFKGTYQASQTGSKRSLLDEKSPLFIAIHDLVMKTWQTDKAGIGNDAKNLSHKMIVVKKIWSVENPSLYHRYMCNKKAHYYSASEKPFASIKGLDGEAEIATRELGIKILDQNLVSEINENYLLHGTSFVQAVEQKGVDHRFSGEGVMFGRGAYFAESSTKADQYADSKDDRKCTNVPLYMFVVRVALGRPYLARKPYKFKKPPCAEPSCSKDNCAVPEHGECQSVIGTHRWGQTNQSTTHPLIFREFIIYHSDQSYPDFLVEYVRT